MQKVKTNISQLAAAVMLLPVLVQAQEIGRTLAARGQVQARAANGSLRTLARSELLLERDTVLIGADGYVQIKLIDDARLALGPNTEFTFDRYSADSDPATPDAAVMSLVQGCFVTISGRIGASPADQYRIETPVATITMRGTMHSGNYDGALLYTGTYAGGTTVSNTQGSLDAGLGGMYDFTRTRAGAAPEGLVTSPGVTCDGAVPQPVAGSLLQPPPSPSTIPVLPIGTPFAPSAPASALQDP